MLTVKFMKLVMLLPGGGYCMRFKTGLNSMRARLLSDLMTWQAQASRPSHIL